MINLKINNADVTVKEGSTIMEAAEKSGIFVDIEKIVKLIKIDINLLPSYIIDNKEKFIDWIEE